MRHINNLNTICKRKYISCVPSVDMKIILSGSVQQGDDLASLVTAYAALRPRGELFRLLQEYMQDTYSPN